MTRARSRRRRSCLRKHRYDNRTDARRELDRIVATTGADPTGMRVYQCPWCAGYHIGKRPGIGGRRP